MRFFQRWRRPRATARIEATLARIEQLVEQIIASEQQLSDDLDAIKTGVDGAIALIVDLKAQIAALGSQTEAVTAAQLDVLTAKADAIVASLNPPAPTA